MEEYLSLFLFWKEQAKLFFPVVIIADQFQN